MKRWTAVAAISTVLMAAVTPAAAKIAEPTAPAVTPAEIEAMKTLSGDGFEQSAACTAYLIFGRSLAMSASPQTDMSRDTAKLLEADARAMIEYTFNLGAQTGRSPDQVDAIIQARGKAMIELARAPGADSDYIRQNIAACHNNAKVVIGAQQSSSAARVSGPPREQADALIAGAKAGDLFENLTTADVIVVRHRLSGLVCMLNPGADDNSIVVFPESARGDDVGCNTTGPHSVISWYAKRNDNGLSLDQAMQHYIAEVNQFTPGLQPYVMPAAVAANPKLKAPLSPDLPLSQTARYVNDQIYTSVTVALVKDWMIELRFTAPADMADKLSGDFEPLLIAAGLGMTSGAVSPDKAPNLKAEFP